MVRELRWGRFVLYADPLDADTSTTANHVNCKPMDKWISVKDRLPETPDNVLAVLHGCVQIMAYMTISEDGETYGVWGYVYDRIDGDAYYDDVYHPTYWMPIPQPPSE